MHRIVFKSAAFPHQVSLSIQADNMNTLLRSYLAVVKEWDLEIGGDGLRVAKGYFRDIEVKSWRIGTFQQWNTGDMANLGWVTFIRDAEALDRLNLDEKGPLRAEDYLTDDDLEDMIRKAQG